MINLSSASFVLTKIWPRSDQVLYMHDTISWCLIPISDNHGSVLPSQDMMMKCLQVVNLIVEIQQGRNFDHLTTAWIFKCPWYPPWNVSNSVKPGVIFGIFGWWLPGMFVQEIPALEGCWPRSSKYCERTFTIVLILLHAEYRKNQVLNQHQTMLLTMLLACFAVFIKVLNP